MTKKLLFQMAAILLACICVTILPLSCYAETLYGVDSKLSTYSPNVIAPTIGDVVDHKSEYVAEMKKNGTYNNYIKQLKEKWAQVIPEEKQKTLNILQADHISGSTRVRTLQEQAQKELNTNHNGLIIGSLPFQNFVTQVMDTNNIDELDSIKTNEKPLYYYLCLIDGMIYDDGGTNIVNRYHFSNLQSLSNFTLADFAEIDAERNFADTIVPSLARSFIQSSISWKKLNGTNIEKYAIKNSTRYNSQYITLNKLKDCTNFASQCLHAGGLAMVYNSKDAAYHKMRYYTTNPKKWYNLKKANAYSNTWISVTELYSFLSIHYPTYETYSSQKLQKQLKIGDIVQGKKIFKRYSHSIVIVHGHNNKSLAYCAHSRPRTQASLSLFYAGFSEYRVIKVC